MKGPKRLSLQNHVYKEVYCLFQSKPQTPSPFDYGAQLGLYTLIGRWYAFSGPCGQGATTGGGAVSCTTACACRRRSLPDCAGDRRIGTPLVGNTSVVDDLASGATHSWWEACGGDVGGVKNSSSLEVS